MSDFFKTMKEKIFLIFAFITSFTFSQVQKIFFVDDVKSIDYVTVKFCVNDSARIDKVTVISEKTTYKNEYVIEQLSQYLKTVQYYPESTLRNNCYPSTFEFVNKKYETAQLSQIDSLKCEKFKIGKFKYLDVRYLDTKIKRTDKKQLEISEDFNAEYAVTWTSPCEYEMTYTKVKEKENENLLGKTIKVKIIGILEESYIFLANFMNEPPIIGEIKKIK